jgi:hypothetical protein
MKNYRFIRALMYGLVSLTLTVTSCGRGCGVGASLDSGGAGRAEGVNRISGGAQVLRAIHVTPNNPMGINSGTRLQFEATGVYADNSEENLTEIVKWTASNMAVVSISNEINSKGQARALSVGFCSITATLNDISGSTSMTVN